MTISAPLVRRECTHPITLDVFYLINKWLYKYISHIAGLSFALGQLKEVRATGNYIRCSDADRECKTI